MLLEFGVWWFALSVACWVGMGFKKIDRQDFAFIVISGCVGAVVCWWLSGRL